MADHQPGWPCPQCGSSNPSDARFCNKCGTPAPVPEMTPPAQPVGQAPDQQAPYQPPAVQQQPAGYPGGLPPAAPPPPKKNSKTKLIVTLSCIGCFIIVLIIGAIGSSSDEKKIKRAYAGAEFNSKADITAFIEKHEINYTEKPDGTWESEFTWNQSTLDELHKQYEDYTLAENRAELEALLATEPTDGCIAYVAGLDRLNKLVRDPALEQRVAERVAGLAPEIAREEINLALARENVTDREAYVEELTALVERAPDAQLKKDLTARITTEEALIERALILGTKPENSAWDGAVACVVDFLKDNLKDPNSVEYIEWSEVVDLDIEGQPYWVVRVKYRAKNSFGGYVIEEKVAFIQQNEVISFEDWTE